MIIVLVFQLKFEGDQAAHRKQRLCLLASVVGQASKHTCTHRCTHSDSQTYIQTHTSTYVRTRTLALLLFFSLRLSVSLSHSFSLAAHTHTHSITLHRHRIASVICFLFARTFLAALRSLRRDRTEPKTELNPETLVRKPQPLNP